MAYFTINGYDSYSGCDIIVTASFPMKTKEGDDIYFTLGSLQTLSVSTHQDKRPVRSLGNINAKDYVMGQRTIAGSLVFAVFDRHFADKIMRSAEVLMADEIPALNLTINFANEYGRSSRMAIYGVKLINEGQVMSINDLYTENTYQFVALGMEPLTADDPTGRIEQGSTDSSKNFGVIGDYNDPVVGTLPKDFQDSSGKVISDKIKNNTDYSNKEGIYITADIEQPIAGEETGIVTIRTTPIQNEGYIYITNLITNSVEYTISVNGSSSYNLELAIGYYNARYMNATRTRESNIEKIVIKTVESNSRSTDEASSKSAYPVIEKITSNSISVSMYNNNFKNIVCFSSGDQEQIATNNKSIVTFENLKADSLYNIYATNEVTESNMMTVKTLPDRNTYFNKFKEYLASNRNMIQNDYNDMIATLNSLLVKTEGVKELIWPYDNIIDGISVLENSLIKQELLLYAMYYENSMTEAFNLANPYKLNIVRNNIFDTDISIDNWNMTKYYSTKNNKNKLEGMLSSEDSFNGFPNKIYSFYGITDETSSIKQYVVIFTAEGKEFLNKYKDVDKYKILDLNYYQAMYPTLNNEELYALTIRDNFLCDKQLLEEPYVYVDNDTVYADVAYDDKVLIDSTYYLCMSEIYSTLDIIPKRKEPFNRQTKLINLNNEYMPLDPNNIYHFWIENAQGNVISKPFVFNYKESAGLNTVLDKEFYSILESKRILLSDKINNSIAIKDIIYNLYCESVPKKDIETKLEYALLDYATKSVNVQSALSYLYEGVLVNTSSRLNINRLNAININKKTKKCSITSGSDLDVQIVTKSYDLIKQETICNIYNTNTRFDLKGDYMTIQLVNRHIDKILGFVVLDCNRLNHRAIGFNVEVGDK